MKWRWEQIESWLLERYDRNAPLTGAEIGVKEGRFIKYMLTGFPNMRIYAIDPRTEQIKGAETYQDWDWDSINTQYRDNVTQFGDRVTELKHFSYEAAPFIQDKSLDFVFIDAQHDYESVKRDITDWLPKVNGLISGHDYDPNPERNYGVIPAVNEIFDEIKTGVNFTWGKWI